MSVSEDVLFDYYCDNDGELFNTSNGYNSSIFGSENLYTDYKHHYPFKYTNEEYKNKFATPIKFINIITQTNKAYLFELSEGVGRWIPNISINSINDNIVWVYEQDYLSKPFKLPTDNSTAKKEVTLESINQKLDLILKLLENS